MLGQKHSCVGRHFPGARRQQELRFENFASALISDAGCE